VRTDELRCNPDEVMTFLKKSASIQLSQDMIKAVTTRTEGWLVGLQLLGLSLHGHADSGDFLEEVSGSQRYIFDYLIEEVFQNQSASVQTFLLHTSILKRLSASLCDTIMEQSGSQQMLEQLERENLFIVSLDRQRHWYRYHASLDGANAAHIGTYSTLPSKPVVCPARSPERGDISCYHSTAMAVDR
jgi:LuxR family maltose regulon positive regulatory protein